MRWILRAKASPATVKAKRKQQKPIWGVGYKFRSIIKTTRMEITFNSIKPLIESEVWEGNQVKLKFKASNQSEAIETIGMAMPDQDEIMKKVMAEMAKSAAANMAINAVTSGIGNLTNTGNLLGGIASQAGLGHQIDTQKLMQVELTDEIKQKTIVNAFTALQAYYEFNNGSWSFKQL